MDHLELKGASFSADTFLQDTVGAMCEGVVGGALNLLGGATKQCVAVLEGLPAVMVLEAEFAFRSMVHVNAVRRILHWPLQWCSRTD